MRRCWVLKGERPEWGPHCCPDMTAQATHACPDHPGGLDCPDRVVYFSPVFREYGAISHPAGEVAVIGFCPWCGARLPASLRERWFAELEALGIDPWAAEVPAAFRSSVWWAAQAPNRALHLTGGA